MLFYTLPFNYIILHCYENLDLFKAVCTWVLAVISILE